MEGPFQYCKVETGRNFVGRKKELGILSNLLTADENVCLYDGPKTGKTSLLHQCFVSMRLSGRDFQAAELSFLGARDSESILRRLASAVLRLGATTPQELAGAVRQYLPGSCWKFNADHYSVTGELLYAEREPGEDDARMVFTLPRRISADSGRPVFTIIEEFQEILLADDGEKLLKIFEQSLREAEIGNSCYIFTGSRINAMKYIFEQKKYFFRNVERVEMQQLDPRELAENINKGFLIGGKVVERERIIAICRRLRCHPWYIRHFAAICDNLSKGYITETTLMDAMDALISIHEPAFIAVTRDLTTFQLRLLRALVCGHTRFSSALTIETYGLNSSANVRRLKDALCRKEIISFDEKGDAWIIDPLFEYWIKDRYFGIK